MKETYYHIDFYKKIYVKNESSNFFSSELTTTSFTFPKILELYEFLGGIIRNESEKNES